MNDHAELIRRGRGGEVFWIKEIKKEEFRSIV
ncbi:MAG: hypothetical protein SYNGOMJ08_00476 [Candidatus Syntrophoarchaeum sp. GoM_oil]|nr:MAG: hypothetical protein SYNGOMJ08_00476 [Candidatus Syntrophoarchaeum sp. GoM_oil]